MLDSSGGNAQILELGFKSMQMSNTNAERRCLVNLNYSQEDHDVSQQLCLLVGQIANYYFAKGERYDAICHPNQDRVLVCLRTHFQVNHNGHKPMLPRNTEKTVAFLDTMQKEFNVSWSSPVIVLQKMTKTWLIWQSTPKAVIS